MWMDHLSKIRFWLEASKFSRLAHLRSESEQSNGWSERHELLLWWVTSLVVILVLVVIEAVSEIILFELVLIVHLILILIALNIF